MVRNKRVVTADLHLLRLTDYRCPFGPFSLIDAHSIKKKKKTINNRLNER